MIGKTVAELGVWVNPEDRALMVQHLRAGQAVRDLEIQLRLRSGEQRVGLLSAESIQWGIEPCLLSMLEDITERRTAERALWQAKELLETMFSAIDLCVAYLDREFNFIRVNRAYAGADAREPEYFVGKNHFALYPPRRK